MKKIYNYKEGYDPRKPLNPKVLPKIPLQHIANGFILLYPLSEDTGGITVPDSQEKKPQRGVVIQIGNALITDFRSVIPPPPLEPGDTIVHSYYNEEIPIEGVTYRFIRFQDYRGKVTLEPVVPNNTNSLLKVTEEQQKHVND